MDYISLIIEDVIKENEKKKSHIVESFSKIKKNDKNVEKKLTFLTIKLLSEGYSFDEIEQTLSEADPKPDGDDWITKYFINNTKETVWSTAKEYLIKYLLQWLGFKNESVTTGISQFLADRPPTVLIKPFKNKEYCVQYLPDITDGIIEVVMRHLMSSASGADKNDYSWKSLGQKGMGNLFGEVIATSNIGEMIADKICNYVHE